MSTSSFSTLVAKWLICMTKSSIPENVKKKLRPIMRDHSLAKFGDTLTNFLYSLAKTKALDKPTGLSVYDKALAEVLRQIGLRDIMPSSSPAGVLGDGVEALIGYVYLEEIMTLEEMTSIITNYLESKETEMLDDRKYERDLMVESFTKLLMEIMNRLIDV
jgi:hypothetical protein